MHVHMSFDSSNTAVQLIACEGVDWLLPWLLYLLVLFFIIFNFSLFFPSPFYIMPFKQLIDWLSIPFSGVFLPFDHSNHTHFI